MDLNQYDKEIEIAKKCRRYGMCKIDFLNTGKCKLGGEKVYAAYHPYGRLKLFQSFAAGELKITDKLIDIINSCTLCGCCNIQCYFLMELTPQKVMESMKKILEERLKGETIYEVEQDEILDSLQEVVGREWATNDPAILLSYATYSAMSMSEKIPGYIVVPETSEETAKIVRIANKFKISFLPISTGSAMSQVAMNNGILIDMNRMKTVEIDEFNFCATVGAGVLAYDLQKEVMKKGFRISIGESCAGVCANQVTSGFHSLFAYKYGMMADLYLEAELVTDKGEIINTSSTDSPNIINNSNFTFEPKVPFICTKLKLRLHEVDNDEVFIMIPFKELAEALSVMRKISKKDIGVAMGLSSIKTLKSLLCLTLEDEDNFLDIAQDYLKMNFGLLMMLTSYELKYIRDKFPDLTILSQETLQKVIMGIPAITGPESMFLIESVMDEERPYEHIFGEMLDYFLKQIALDSDEISDLFFNVGDEKLQKALTELYFKPEFSNIKHWFDYRYISPRINRKRWHFPNILFTTFDNTELIQEIFEKFENLADKKNVENYLCYVTPIDKGKRLTIEYDFFFDQNDSSMVGDLKKAIFITTHEMNKMKVKEKGVYPGIHTYYSGLKQKGLFLYK